MEKKILHVVNKIEIGGVEVGILSLLENKKEFDYKVLAIKGVDERLYKILPARIKNNIIIVSSYFSALRYIYKYKPDYLISSLWRSRIPCSIYKIIGSRCKLFSFFHNARYAHKIDHFTTLLVKYLSDEFISDSEITRQWLESKINKNSTILPMNVYFDDGVLDTAFDNQLRFVFAGRFSKQKQLMKSIDFIYEISKQFEVVFDLYGRDDGELEKIKCYVESLGLAKVVSFYGSVNPFKINDVMRKYSFYLQTSSAEGMAISVFQSIKNGLIPVVTPVGEIENYTSDGVNAFYIGQNEIVGSAKKFVDDYRGGKFYQYNSGVILNENAYPVFADSFFEFFNNN